jgi:hypothetical protein
VEHDAIIARRCRKISADIRDVAWMMDRHLRHVAALERGGRTCGRNGMLSNTGALE